MNKEQKLNEFLEELNAKEIKTNEWATHKGHSFLTIYQSNGTPFVVSGIVKEEVLTAFEIYIPCPSTSIEETFNDVRRAVGLSPYAPKTIECKVYNTNKEQFLSDMEKSNCHIEYLGSSEDNDNEQSPYNKYRCSTTKKQHLDIIKRHSFFHISK